MLSVCLDRLAGNIKSCIAQACRAPGDMDRLAFPAGKLNEIDRMLEPAAQP
jgi:hypothetical protein